MLLNAMSRQYILNEALSHAFDKRKHAMEVEYERIATAIYDAFFTRKQQATINDLPKCFYREGGTVRFNMAGQNREWTFSNKDQIKGAPVTAFFKLPSETWHPVGALSQAKHAALIERIVSYDLDKAVYKEDRNKAEKTLIQLLKGTKTLEQLKEVWPEGVKFYKGTKAAVPTPPGLPAIAMADLNKMLGVAQAA